MESSSRATAEISTSGWDNLESLIRDILDYFGSSIEQSVWNDLDLQKFREKYLILEEFQLVAPGQDGRITEPSEGYVAFNDEALRSGLRFSLHLFFYNVLEFYRLHST